MTLIGVTYSELILGVVVIFGVAMLVAARTIIARMYRHAPTDLSDTRRADEKLVAKLSSKGLAALIVQALVESKMLDGKKADDALQVAAQKIDLRKALGDY